MDRKAVAGVARAAVAMIASRALADQVIIVWEISPATASLLTLYGFPCCTLLRSQ